MLEFIVLGIIPGTRFNITFAWVLAAAAVFLIVLEVRYHKNYALKVQALAAASSTDVVKPAKPTRKKRTTSAKATSSVKNTKARRTTKRTSSKKPTRSKA
jgi:hypothetical protein